MVCIWSSFEFGCEKLLQRIRFFKYDLSISAGIGRIYTMTRDELLRQKFILDVLKQVELPLQNRDLNLEIDLDDIADENLYTGV